MCGCCIPRPSLSCLCPCHGPWNVQDSAVRRAEPVETVLDLEPVREPGIYDLPADVYHRDACVEPSLSASGSKLLLPPNCPARYAYDRAHGSEPRDVFDLGTAAHAAVLGVGTETVVVEADSWATKAAKEAKAAARAEGKTPLLRADADRVDAMTAALRSHPITGPLFTGGQAEQAMFWRDETHGIWCRAMVDYLRVTDRALLVDLKTCASADPTQIAKAVANFGYHVQAAHYLDGARRLGIPEPVFLFAFVEKAPPHLITVCELDADALEAGRRKCEQARALFAMCRKHDHWPAYADTDEIPIVALPAWASS